LASDAPGSLPEPDATKPLLTARNVKRHFGGIKAVDGMDVDVYPRELVGLIGPNGAGKTTFFNLIAGTDRSDAGVITFDGTDITRRPPHRTARLGLVRTFQLTRTLSRMTVTENLLLAPKGQIGERLWAPYVPVLGRPLIAANERALHEKAMDLLEYFGLTHLKDEYAGALSGGQRKLLELARALMLDPKMLLLDEPMAGVNPSLAKRLMDRIQGIRRDRGITILLIEHDMETVMNHCERIVVMAEGRMLAIGTPDEVKNNAAVIEAYLGG
jgi:ABC-type branched-subunit amino acid transport system ATPase component